MACDLLIKNARVFDGSVVREGLNSVGIADNKISFLGRSDDSAAREIDAHGRFLMPGLIDCHIHLLNLWTAKDETTMAVDLETELPKRLNDFLAAGVTTVKSVGDERMTSCACARGWLAANSRAPVCWQPDHCFALGSHPATTICGQNAWLRYRTTVETDSPEQAREAVRRLAGKKVDAIKIAHQGGCRHGEPYFFKNEALGLNVQICRVEREVLEAIIDEAHKHGLKVTVHTFDQEAAIEALETGADGLEHGIMDHKVSGDRVIEYYCGIMPPTSRFGCLGSKRKLPR